MSLASKMLDAAHDGNAEEVIRLASQESNPFSVASPLAEGALLGACEYGQLSVVRACILELKCNPNCVDKSGRSPLHMAVLRKGNGKLAVSIVKFLCSKGAKIRKSVLHVCCNDLAVQPLLELKADVNARSVDNLTPIAAAVAADKQEVVTELVRAGCIISNDIIFAAKSTSVAMELVRARVDINFRNSDGITALQKAVALNDKRLARCLLEAKADPTIVSRLPSVDEDISSSTASSGHVTRSNSIALSLSGKDFFSRIHELASTISKYASSDRIDGFPSLDAEEWLEAERIMTKASTDIQVITEKIEEHKKAAAINSCCVVCRSRVKSVVLMPCKHLCCCLLCAKALEKGGTWDASSNDVRNFKPQCPLCRLPFDEAVNVFT